MTAARLTFSEALDRLEREARQGVVDTGRYRGRYYDWGEGPPLIFINGVGDEPRSFARQMALLSGQFRCIAYRLPMGLDDGAKLRRYRHDDLTADLFALHDHLRLEPATLFGHSFGSTIAVKALHHQPARFTRGVLACGFAFRPLSSWHWWLGALGKALPRSFKLKDLRGRVVALRKTHYLGFERHEPECWETFLKLTGESPAGSLGHWAHMLHKLDLRPLLKEIRQPTLLLCGDADPLMPHVHQEALFQGLPNAVMFQLQSCGHLPMYTHPEATANAVLTFVGYLPPPGLVHECGQGPTAEGQCPTTGQVCFGKEMAPAAATCGEKAPALAQA